MLPDFVSSLANKSIILTPNAVENRRMVPDNLWPEYITTSSYRLKVKTFNRYFPGEIIIEYCMGHA